MAFGPLIGEVVVNHRFGEVWEYVVGSLHSGGLNSFVLEHPTLPPFLRGTVPLPFVPAFC